MPIVNTQQNVIPNGLLYIGAILLSRNIPTEIINLSNKSWDGCRNIIKEMNPDIVGICCYTFNRHTCIKLAEIVKEVNKNIKVVFGGPHSSIMYAQLFDTSYNIDVIVLNEGEITFLELVNNLQGNTQLKNIPGIIYRENGKIINNGLRQPLESLDKLPIPAEYFRYKRIITSRGCPGRCIFCDTPHLWGQKVRLRSPINVVDELELLNKKYGISSFIISDDTFTLGKERAIEICKEIIRRDLKITWDCRSRVNLICEERLMWMKKAGCTTISYGIESGSQKILNNLKKGIKVEQIKEAASLTRKFGLNLNYFIIVGSPGETDDTIRETMKVIEETKPTSIFTYIMQLTPGTELYETAKQSNFIKDNDWMDNKDETIFYTKEKTLKELVRYINLISELFRVLRAKFQYKEEDLEVIKKEFTGVQDLINLSHIKMKNKELDQSEKLLDEAIRINPGSSEALMNKAVLLSMKEDKKSIKFFNDAIKADPENLLAYKNLGLFLFKQKNYAEATEIFKKEIGIEPADVDLYNSLGSIYGTNKEYDKAINTFKSALLIDPNNKEALKNLELTIRLQKNQQDNQ